MSKRISDILLSRLSEFVAAQMALYYPRDRWRDLERGIVSAAREFGFDDVESCIELLVSSPLTKNQVETLASHLTVGETYFFREKKSFEILEEDILPALIRQRRATDQRIRIWSAGCCTGEEPYSIAVMLSKIISDWKDWNITILATDINPRFLQKASQGKYGEWSFRDAQPSIKEKYFTRTQDGRYEILPSIKNMVQFSYLNLAEDAYPSLHNNTNAIDIIFCRNVLMYFTQERAKNVIQNLYRSLLDGGWLCVSPSETSHVLYPQFTTMNFSGAVLYKKERVPPGFLHTPDLFIPTMIEETKVQSTPEFELLPETKVEEIFTHESKETVPVEVEKEHEAESEPSTYHEVFALYERGFYDQAEQKILSLLPRHRDGAKLMALLARVYANQGKLVEAHEYSEKATTVDKLNPAYRYLLATILQEQGRLDPAKESLKQALYLNQNFVLAHFALGTLAHRQGKRKEAEKHFHNALTLLGQYKQEDVLPESDGLTAGRLREIIRSATET